MKRIILIILFCSCVKIYSADDITSGFEFLRTDFNPRTSATANAFSTFRGDVGTVYSNPAGLAYAMDEHYVFNYTNYLLDINGGMAAYTHEIEEFGKISYGVIYLNYGSFDNTDMYANKTGGTFTASDVAFSVGWARHFEKNLSYGANLKYIFSNIDDYSASAIALDLGLIFDASAWQQDLYFAFSVLNLGTNFEYFDQTATPLPLTVRAGFSKELEHLPLELAVSLNELNRSSDGFGDYFKRFSIGGEFRLSESLRLRLGYNNLLHSDMKALEESEFGGISGGLGIHVNTFRIDYSYSNYNLLGNVHRFGIQGTL
jgi:hypothetical protein